MSEQQVPADRLAELLRELPAGTYTLWGVQYEGRRGTHVTVARDVRGRNVSTLEAAERDLAELRSWRGVPAHVVSRTVTVTDSGWQPAETVSR
ncbi:hypothetical protein [Micromonospora aurantiaca (nom. illeg.)]|uniref:hypothetical protein n=1 Tax=Micromonospora aurantiaca (nom. illeg.) TaxID=47850 RepID=UPI0033E80E46